MAKASKSTKTRRRNPSTSFREAEELSRQFHGREPEEVEELTEVEEYDKNLAKLGELEELSLISEVDEDDGGRERITPISFEDCSVKLAAKGNQISFVGGDQELDLEQLVEEIPELENQVRVPGRFLIDLGEVYSIVYFTDKHHLSGPKSQAKGSSYEHCFGEEETEESQRPRLMYDRRNAKLNLVGGSYEIRAEGIWD